jgi:hypothetical protein
MREVVFNSSHTETPDQTRRKPGQVAPAGCHVFVLAHLAKHPQHSKT